MARRFLTPINILNAASDPGTANEGDLYYNTVSDILRIYANGSWSDVSGGGSSSNISINTQTSSYTPTLLDSGKVIEMNSASANNFTIPLNSVVSFSIGTTMDVIQYGAGQTTIVPDSGVTVRSKDNNLKLTGQYSAVSLYKRDTDEWVAIGDLSA